MILNLMIYKYSLCRDSNILREWNNRKINKHKDKDKDRDKMSINYIVMTALHPHCIEYENYKTRYNYWNNNTK
jgi:hypothetical protein